VGNPAGNGLGVDLTVCDDATAMGAAAAAWLRERVSATPDLVLGAPAGRSPRPMYRALEALQATAPVDFSRLTVFAVDDLSAPAPADGVVWRQVRRDLLSWAGPPPARCHAFTLDAPDLHAMCRAYEAAIAAAGGLDLVIPGLGPNGHLGGNEPGSAFDSRTRPVDLAETSVRYFLSDSINAGCPCGTGCVTLGLGTVMDAREVLLLAAGPLKRAPLRRLLEGPASVDLPASVLRGHPRCRILADHAAAT
jgi:glucosamine-6-phosphate deaminase